MNISLLIIVIALLCICILLILKIYFLRKTIKEIDRSFDYILKSNTNNIISVTSEDKYLKQLATILNQKLKDLRITNQMTQADVAKYLNTSQAAYAHYENARYLIPTSFLITLTKIYKPFSIDDLFK